MIHSKLINSNFDKFEGDKLRGDKLEGDKLCIRAHAWPSITLAKKNLLAPAAFWRVKMWLQKQRDKRHKI